MAYVRVLHEIKHVIIRLCFTQVFLKLSLLQLSLALLPLRPFEFRKVLQPDLIQILLNFLALNVRKLSVRQVIVEDRKHAVDFLLVVLFGDFAGNPRRSMILLNLFDHYLVFFSEHLFIDPLSDSVLQGLNSFPTLHFRNMLNLPTKTMQRKLP